MDGSDNVVLEQETSTRSSWSTGYSSGGSHNDDYSNKVGDYSYDQNEEQPLREQTLQNFRKDINFILDDIKLAYYPVGREELNLHRMIYDDYNLSAAKRLYELISEKTPFRRIWDVFKYFRVQIYDLGALVKKIQAMDRIHRHREGEMKVDLRNSFYDEYSLTIEDVVEVVEQIVKMGIFFEYFIPENDLLLENIFNCNNLQALYVSLNNVLHVWDLSKLDNQRTREDYHRTLENIRKIDLDHIYQIVLDWKTLRKRIKKYYPSSRIWYSKKYYFDYVHELINLLEKYHEYIKLGSIESLYPDKQNKETKKKRLIKHLSKPKKILNLNRRNNFEYL